MFLVRDGRMQPRNMRAELITKDELMTHLREEGIDTIADLKQACMEPDGMIGVIRTSEGR